MGTSNFHTENASQTYMIEDDNYYDGIEDNIGCSIKEKVEKVGFDFQADTDIKLNSELRSFPSRSIGSVWKYINYMGFEVCVTVIPLIRSGYYEGCNLDYETTIELDGTYYEDGQEIIFEIEENIEYHDVKPGIFAIHKDRFEKKIDNTLDEIIEMVEESFKDITTPLNVVATMSNGETIYEVA